MSTSHHMDSSVSKQEQFAICQVSFNDFYLSTDNNNLEDLSGL